MLLNPQAQPHQNEHNLHRGHRDQHTQLTRYCFYRKLNLI